MPQVHLGKASEVAAAEFGAPKTPAGLAGGQLSQIQSVPPAAKKPCTLQHVETTLVRACHGQKGHLPD